MKRREFIALPAKCLGGLLVYTMAGLLIHINEAEGTVSLALQFFTAAEARTIAAACERIFPNDESGPGATQASVIIYIDRQLVGPYGHDRYRYTKGPFLESAPEHGYQGKANPQEIYREGPQKLGADFADIDGLKQDERLRAIEMTIFFECYAPTQLRECLAIPCMVVTQI